MVNQGQNQMDNSANLLQQQQQHSFEVSPHFFEYSYNLLSNKG
jgi:hypothetical protein